MANAQTRDRYIERAAPDLPETNARRGRLYSGDAANAGIAGLVLTEPRPRRTGGLFDSEHRPGPKQSVIRVRCGLW